MSNIIIFTGRLSGAPELTHHGETKVAKFILIRNEYAGKDKAGKAKERTVAVQFTAFNGTAAAIAEHCRKGDQLIVTAGISNNNYEKDGDTVYGFNFVVSGFEFGAPGPEKRQMLGRGQAAERVPAATGGDLDDDAPF
jgi:single-strand DNA-binding protein